MGLLQKAVETYDNMSHLAGVDQEGKVTLAPIGFISTKAQLIITLDLDGKFIAVEKTDEKVIIPVTEKSAGRSSGSAATTPHPICEQIKFLIPTNKASYEAYLTQLEMWCLAYPLPAIKAVLQYVKSGSITEDLTEIKYGEKDIVCWKVLNSGIKDEIWKNPEVQSAFREFYSHISSDEAKAFCYVSGDSNVPAKQHLKGVVPLFGNAKIISSNDTSNFTYLGRFLSAEEVTSVSYEASQKAHNALKWLVENEGETFGGEVIVCWNPHGIDIPKSTLPLLPFKHSDEKPSPTQYKEKLYKVINGYKQNLQFDDQAVIVAFSAATTGRLAITYYNEFSCYDFLERMKNWDEYCSWYSFRFGTYSPTIKDIVKAAFGVQRNDLIEVDDKVLGEQIYRILLCKLEGSLFPDDIMRYAVEKCGNLQILKPENRSRQLFTTCAIIRKNLYDHKKEEWSMALEPNRRDRSYQYGRLLAVLEKAERDTYNKNEGEREPNAMRLQSVFVKRPAYATKIILEQVKTAYYPRLSIGTRTYYEKLLGDIIGMISDIGEKDINRPLGETYLLGYYLQKNELYIKKTENKKAEDVDYE